MAEQPPPLELPAHARRDPVLHETMTAIMWVAHAAAALAEGRTELARHMAGLAGDSVMKALQLADEGPMVERDNYRQAHRALHALWTKHVGTPGYEKREWKELDQAIYRLATDGPGPAATKEPDPRG